MVSNRCYYNWLQFSPLNYILKCPPIYPEFKYIVSKGDSYIDVEQFIIECMRSLKLAQFSFTRLSSCYMLCWNHIILYIT